MTPSRPLPTAVARALGALWALVALAAVPAAVRVGEGGPAPARAARVVLVVLGGGVRAADVLGRADLTPTVRGIAQAGFGADGWAVGGADPVDATEAVLTGRDVAVETPGRVRPRWPTLMEAVRRGLSLAPTDVWYASFADGEALELAASDHPDHGARFAPSLAVGDGPFGEPLRPLFALYGRPNPTAPRAWELLAGLRGASSVEAARRLGVPVDSKGAAEALRIERALLEEVDRRSRDLAGPAALDVRALRAAVSVLRLFRPRLVVVRLGQADVASKDLYAYWDVLKRVDAELTRLRAAVAEDPELRATTNLVVVGDLGRDARQNAAGGYGRSDGSPDQTRTFCVGVGPGLRKGASPRGKRAARDVAPTLAALLGASMPTAEGAVLDELLAR